MVLKRLKRHILTLHEKIGLLVLYGAVMFCLGMGANYLFAPPAEVPETYDADVNLPAERPEEAGSTAELQQMLEQSDEEPATEGAAPVESEKPGYSEYVTELTVRKGDNVTDLLIKAGVDRQEAHLAADALAGSYNLRQLQIGQKLYATFREGEAHADGESGETEFVLLRIEEPERVVTLEKAPDGTFALHEAAKQLRRELKVAQGVIDSSLYLLAAKLSIPANVLQDAINAYSYDVDFQRDVQPGTRFGVLYETFLDEDGKVVRDGDMLYALLTVDDKDMEIFRFSPTKSEDDADYYTADGAVLRKQLMKTPIDGARISSPFGMRKHPISGYTKMHKGVDFAAPRGTPVYASGDGYIRQIGWNGGYGNYIRIRHSTDYETAYGHLNRFAKGMKRGRKVKQGQVIAYVGSTGRSTGPHLHFEILQKGEQINPISVKLAAARKLDGAALKALKSQVEWVREQLAARHADPGQGPKL